MIQHGEIGKIIEDWVIESNNYKQSNINECDCYDNKNTPIEIKSCKMIIRNGNNEYGQKYTKGRFYIVTDNHKWLYDKNGLYYFVVYDIIESAVWILAERSLPVRFIDKFLKKISVKNKIKYDKIINRLHLPILIDVIE